MWFRSEKAEAIISYDICNVTTTEMHQMATMRDRVETILNSHREKDAKKQYLSDDELERIWAILSVLNANGRAMLVCTQQLSRFCLKLILTNKIYG